MLLQVFGAVGFDVKDERMAPTKKSLIQPPAEAQEIVSLFSEAADALMAGGRNRANKLIARADQCWVRSYVGRAWGTCDREIHPWNWNPDYKARKRVPEDQRDSKEKPGRDLLRRIFERDAWHCRYCGIPVMDDEAFKKLRDQKLEALYWGSKNKDKHPGACLIWGVYDHVIPHSAGGCTDKENLVTACWPCNAAKYNALLDEAGLADPRKSLPAEHGSWEGLRQLLKLNNA